jgi:uncharacterized protein (DUF2336 family)
MSARCSTLDQNLIDPMMLSSNLIDELEFVLSSSSQEHRADILRKITDMFIGGATSYSDEQLKLFDDILTRLTQEIEDSVKAELSLRLCDAKVATPRLLRQFALDRAIEVAAPVLARSEHLDELLLVQCAHTQSQGHLLAISHRRRISEAVTDELVVRGEAPVLQCVVDNTGARFSNNGFATLIRRGEGNDALAVAIGTRADLPRHHFLRLLAAASSAVREELAAASPQDAQHIQTIVAQVTKSIATRTVVDSKEYIRALKQVGDLNSRSAVGDREILHYITDQKFELVVATIAVLAELDVVEVEKAMVDDRSENLLMIVKAVDLGWPTAKALLQFRAGKHGVSLEELDQALSNFTRLKADTARQVLILKRRAKATSSETSRLPLA